MKKPMFSLRLLASLIVVAMFAACSVSDNVNHPGDPPNGGASGDIRLDPSTRFQTIVGWEATAQAGQDHAQFASFSNRLFDQAATELGITRLRIEPRASIEFGRDLYGELKSGAIDLATYRCLRNSTQNDNGDPRVINPAGFHFTELDEVIDKVAIPLRQRLAARGESLYLVATYVAFIGSNCAGTSYHHTDPAEYAEFVLATYRHMQQKYGFVPDAWEVILEPDNTSFWRGRQIGQAILAAGNLLQQNGFTPRFIAPSNKNMGAAVTYFDDLVAIPGAIGYVSELAYHRYGGVSDANLQAIAARVESHGIKSSMLEHIGSGHEDLHRDLSLGRVSAWQQFALAYPTSDNGAQYFVITNNGGVQLGSRSRYLRQYFRYVRPGAVRIGAETSRDELEPLAFINTEGRHVVVVKANGQSSFTVGGLPAGTYGTTYTTDRATHTSAPDVTLKAGELLSAEIPARGVLTIFRR